MQRGDVVIGKLEYIEGVAMEGVDQWLALGATGDLDANEDMRGAGAAEAESSSMMLP